MARKKTRLATRDSLSNLAASLGAGKDKAANDAFFVAELARDQIEAMYRGDWLARKIVDIVPYDSIREWREWSGDRAAVAAVEATERQLGLRKAVQRAMILGRLYGGGAIVIGTDAEEAAELARPLVPESVGPGGLRFLHVLSRWQLAADAVSRDPLDPFFGEPQSYAIEAPGRGELVLHPSRVVRFLGNPLPDALLHGAQAWSDSVLQSLYDAIHAVAVTGAGATSLVHEAKVDVVTVPNLSEHLANAATTAQLSARFSYAAAMKSINNLLLLGDGESWSRQTIDFAGLPEMVRTFLQVAAGAADVPVTRLLGQSPAGLSATGESDTRNYYDMIAARQELDLRPQLERLDAVLLRAAGVEAGAVRFAFRPLWQLSAAEKAQVALQKAQATAVYAGLQLWPVATTAALVRSQLMEDGTYPGAEGVFGGEATVPPPAMDPQGAPSEVSDYSPDQPRDPDGRWTSGGGSGGSTPERSVTRVGRPAASSSLDPDLGEPGPLGRNLGLFDPIGSASAQEAAPRGAGRTIVAAHIHEDPLNNEAPEDEEEEQAREQLKEIDDPLRGGPRVRPDGTLAVPLPMAGEQAPAVRGAAGLGAKAPLKVGGSVASPPPASTSSALIPPPPNLSEDDWLKVGPGPYAGAPIPASSRNFVSKAERTRLNQDGSAFGCHRCGNRDPGTPSGIFVGDHQPSTGLIVEGQPQFLLPHCDRCSRIQGGQVLSIMRRGRQR